LSLVKCLKKIAITGADKKAINAIAEDLYTDGMTEEEIKIAENLAVEQYLSTVDKDLDDIATRAESMGGKVSKFDDSKELSQSDEDLSVYDEDFPITHSGGKITEIEKGGVFSGVFGERGDESFSGVNLEGNQTTFLPRKGKVADEGDIDFDYDKSIEFIKKEFPDANEETIDQLYEIIAEDKNVFDMDENPLEEYGFDDLGEASWEGQRLRGQLAVSQGFDAVAMDDETGVSYLIPSGSKAINMTAKESTNLLAQSGELSQFAGELADNAPVKKLQQAKSMKDKGQSTEVIRRETGWFKGVDNKWRYEISDDAAEFKIQINTIKEKLRFKASELIDHPILFDAYQDIKDTVIIFDPDLELGSKGMYSPKNDSITLATGLTEQETMSILLHEIQHAIQEREGFARGGSADENFVSSIKHALKGLKTGKETDVKSWEWKNDWKIGEAKTAAMVALDGLMYKSATKLMEYANHPTPSSVFRHVRNEVQWLYHDRFQQDRAIRDEVNEIQRMFYDIPKRGPKRNEKIGQIAYKTAQLLRENIGSNSLRRFKNDERTLNGMIKALERESDKKRKELEPLQELKKEATSARRVEDKTRFKTPYRVYEALAGEIEARTTQARQNLTADERRDRSVLQDMDIQPDEAIVIMGGNEILAPSSMMSQQLKQPDRASFKPMSSAAKMVDLTVEEMQEYKDLNQITESQKKEILTRFEGEITEYIKNQQKEEKADLIKEETEALSKKEIELDEEIIKLDKEVDSLTKQSAKLSRKNDTIGRFIAKNGGLNRESMKAEGVDPEYFKSQKRLSGKPVFPAKGGLTPDGLAELLNEQKFAVEDISANDALKLINDMLVEDNTLVNQEAQANIENLNNEIDNIESNIRELKAEKVDGDIKNEATKNVEQRLSERYSDSLKDGTIQAEALKRFNEIAEGRAGPGKKFINPNLENSIIKLSKASDLSSFLHESAHLFLDMEGRFATEELTADQQTILDFLGLESFNDLIIDGEITPKQREAHEKWAETFEVYLREGKAPSSDLREAFAAFKSWLIQIYKTLSDPRLSRADLTPEIKEVFDRLLASEIEIEQMKANPAYDKLFKNKEQAGMTDQQWEAYQKQVDKAHNRSQQNLDDKLIKELISRKTKEWKEEKKPLIAEELGRLSDEPIYQLIDALKDTPMDIALVREALGIEPTKKGENKSQIEKFIGKHSKKEGIDPHDYQNEYGFNSIEHMFQSLIDAKPIKKAANENAEQQMIDKHGDILNDGSIEMEVRESVHNDEQAKLALMELREP
jgi:hypothetical protein